MPSATAARLRPARRFARWWAVTGDAAVARGSAGTPGRGPLFAGLCLLAFANGSFQRVLDDLQAEGFWAVMNTFGISAVAWLGLAACLKQVANLPGPPTRRDLAIALVMLLAALLPAGPLSWLALTLLAAHLLLVPESRGAGWVLLALCGNMAWGRWLMLLAAGPVLEADARMVGWLTGAAQAGNTLRLNDSPLVFIAPACSSLANVSVAWLAATLCVQHLRLYRGAEALWRTAAAIAAAVAVNVARVSTMLLHPDWFAWLHDGGGATLAAWLSFGLIAFCCLFRTRPGDPARA